MKYASDYEEVLSLRADNDRLQQRNAALKSEIERLEAECSTLRAELNETRTTQMKANIAAFIRSY
jgi:uncharacterized small protein (DUF1192 family)